MATVKTLLEQDIQAYETATRNALLHKYFNMYISRYKAVSDIDEHTLEYILKRFWYEGTVAAFRVMDNETLNEIAYAPYTAYSWDMYDFPLNVNLINKRCVRGVFPNKKMINNKNVVLGWYAKNHLPVKEQVLYYVDRIVQIEMLIHNNLALQNMPYIVQVDNKSINKMKNIVNKVLNNELAIYTDADLIESMQVLQTNAPYLINDLQNQEDKLENKLLTYLGINNNPVEKAERLVTGEVDSNNEVITFNDDMQCNTINDFFDNINKLFNKNIKIESMYDKIKEKEGSAEKWENGQKE